MRRLPLLTGVMLAFLIAAAGWVMRTHTLLPMHRGDFAYGLQIPAETTPVKPASDAKLTPSPDDAKIATVTAQLLSREDYQHHALDVTQAGLMLDEYYNSLDPRHIYFLQSDIDEFNVVKPSLGDMLLHHGDTGLATTVFERLLQRVDQQIAFIGDELKNQTFTFDSDDTWQVDRKDAPRPKDMDEAHRLWHDDLRYEYLQEKLGGQKPDDIVKTLTRRYTRLARSLHELDHADVLESFLNGLAHSYDPHSDYLGKSALEQFNTQMTLSLVGIGASLISEDGYAKIADLIPGGPAIKSGQLKANDRIVAVAQGPKDFVDVVDLKLDRVVDMIRGQKGTTVRLKIIPADAPDPSTRKTVVLIRDEVKLDEQAAKAMVIDMPAGGKTTRLGVITLPSFYSDADSQGGNHKSTTADVARLLKKLEAVKVDGVILDLRNNPGGSLQEVINLTGLFIKQGPVVQVKDIDGSVQVDRTDEPPVYYGGPLIVMTTRLSASASEILAGALQDYGRALIVGDTSTFGKGTVQTLIPLKSVMQRITDSKGAPIELNTDPGDLKLTIQKFYRPSGSSTQLRGVSSDIVLPSITNVLDVGEKSLDHPLAWDTVPTASFDKSTRLQTILPELKQRSDARVAHEEDFIYLKQQIDQVRSAQTAKTVSLNEQKRQEEKRQNEARAAEQRKALLALPAPNETVYMLTLDLAGRPGLPAPTPWSKLTQAKQQAAASDDTAVGATASPNMPNIDSTLNETEHILMDMIDLTAHPLVRSGG